MSSRLFERLAKRRGFLESFLYPKYDDCIDPFSLPDMRTVIERVKKAILNNEKILIYGDYDVDGITASIVIHDALELAGCKKLSIMLPNRFKDGYGMNKKIVQYSLDNSVSLVFTVDCGSNNNEIIDELNNVGIDTIVTDHHECLGMLPKAVGVVNAKRSDFQGDSFLRDLAGVGVAFEVVRALVAEGLIPFGQEKWLLDLVLIGTICDNMVMSAENRRFCFYGLKVISKTRRRGLKELMRISGVKKLNTDAIGFQIGPRINASGRMDSPDLALKLLMSSSSSEASVYATILDGLNKQRRQQQNDGFKQISESMDFSEDNVIVATGEWYEGVLGIIAGKLTEQYKKPSFVLTKMNGYWKGSGRSFGDFSLVKALKACDDIIISGGGHAGACGVKVTDENIGLFNKKVNEYYKSLNLVNQEVFFDKNEDLVVSDFDDFNLDFYNEIEQLEPFGVGNEQPIFLLKNVFVSEVCCLGQNREHIKIIVFDSMGHNMKLMAFYAPDEWKVIRQAQRINVWIKIEMNEWNNVRSIEGRIEKISIADEGDF